jgi:hypothetical protein
MKTDYLTVISKGKMMIDENWNCVLQSRWDEIEAIFEEAALEYFDYRRDTMATDLGFLMSEPELVTPNWEMIEFIEEENKRIKDLRNAHRLIS